MFLINVFNRLYLPGRGVTCRYGQGEWKRDRGNKTIDTRCKHGRKCYVLKAWIFTLLLSRIPMANMFYKSFLMLGLKRTDGQTVGNRHIHSLRKRGIYNQRRRPEAQARSVHAAWRLAAYCSFLPRCRNIYL